MRTIMAAAICAIAIVTSANAAIKEEPVTYTDGQTTMKGFVVYDDADHGQAARRSSWCMNGGASPRTSIARRGSRAAGLHGLHCRHVRRRQDRRQPEGRRRPLGLGDEGPEGDGVALQRRAGQLAKHASVNPQRVGAVGYCFGGAVVLNMARTGADLAAVAAFHASLGLNTPAPAPGTVKAKILVLNGADDPFVKREQYDTSRRISTPRRPTIGSSSIPGAVHAFTNPGGHRARQKFNLPLKYDARSTSSEGRGGQALRRQPQEIRQKPPPGGLFHLWFIGS
jgi:dienelactone hydrolase